MGCFQSVDRHEYAPLHNYDGSGHGAKLRLDALEILPPTIICSDANNTYFVDLMFQNHGIVFRKYQDKYYLQHLYKSHLKLKSFSIILAKIHPITKNLFIAGQRSDECFILVLDQTMEIKYRFMLPKCKKINDMHLENGIGCIVLLKTETEYILLVYDECSRLKHEKKFDFPTYNFSDELKINVDVYKTISIFSNGILKWSWLKGMLH